MSEPIDLGLVELRCRLRGWHCDRRGSSLDAYTDHGNISMAASGEWSCVGQALGAQRLLTAPRWTLDRLLSSPPDGWTCLWSREDAAKLHRDGVAVWLWRDIKAVELDFETTAIADLPLLAERLHAAAELALILAEVEP